MKNRGIYCAAVCLLTAAVLAGCGDGSEEGMSIKSIEELETVDLEADPEPEETPDAQTPEATPEPAAGDMAVSGGGGITESEMDPAVLEGMETLLQNLELPEYLGEAIHMVSSEEWIAGLAKDMYEGCRSYSLHRPGQALLSVQVGYDAEEKPYINVYYQKETGEMVLLKQGRGVTWLLQTTVAEGAYNGAFEKWQINSETGYMRKETGTYAKGIIVGEYTKSERTGGAGDAFDLWTNRENFEYASETVNYNDQGEIAATPTPQPTVTPKPATTPQPTQRPTATPKPTEEPTPEPTQIGRAHV